MVTQSKFESETWFLVKIDERRTQYAEMKSLRNVNVFNSLNGMKNNNIRASLHRFPLSYEIN